MELFVTLGHISRMLFQEKYLLASLEEFFLNIERGEGSIKCHGGTDYYNLTIIAKKVTGAVKVVRSND